jgi:hypothetical protein
MTTDKSIFGVPFIPDENLLPRPEQLTAFIERAGKDGGLDLEPYRRLIEDTEAFDQEKLHEAKREDLPATMRRAVFHYSRFAHRGFLSAVELYAYHLNTLKLKSSDFRSPASFIRSAEQTISRLNKDKLDDVLRMASLQEMINERKNIIEKIRQPSAALTSELLRIAQYLRGNLNKIEKRCTASISMLSDRGVTGRKENQMIEDIKERPQKALQAGKIAMQDLDRAVREVNLIADKMSSIVRDDIEILKNLYETMQGQLKKALQVIDILRVEVGNRKDGTIEELQQPFEKVERALVSLLSSPHHEQLASNIQTETAYEKFITQKRKEMLDYLFAVLQKERRSRPDRRTSGKRRNVNETIGKKPERRNGKDRRTGQNRRKG